MTRLAENEVRRTMVRSVCRHLGVGEIPAGTLVENVMNDLMESHGGCDLYVPIRSKEQVIDMVRAAYTGTNMVELCDRFDISKSTFYRYLGKSE